MSGLEGRSRAGAVGEAGPDTRGASGAPDQLTAAEYAYAPAPTPTPSPSPSPAPTSSLSPVALTPAQVVQLVPLLLPHLIPALVAALNLVPKSSRVLPLWERLKSRKLWVAITGVLLTVAEQLRGNLSGPHAATAYTVIMGVYVLAQGISEGLQG